MLEVGFFLLKERFEGNDAVVFHPHIKDEWSWIVPKAMYKFGFQISISIMQIIAKLYRVQEVPGNVGNRKGVNGKYYFSIYEI